MSRFLKVAVLLAAPFLSGSLAVPVHANPLLLVRGSVGCWVHSAAGYRPRLSLDVVPTQKLEALAISVQFVGAGQSPSPLLSVQYDAELNVHDRPVLTGHSAVTVLPGVPSTALVSARILPYAARNTTALGQVRSETLLSVKLPSVVCRG